MADRTVLEEADFIVPHTFLALSIGMECFDLLVVAAGLVCDCGLELFLAETGTLLELEELAATDLSERKLATADSNLSISD